MAAASRAWAAGLLHFWFHELPPGRWFRSGPDVDAALRRRFGRYLAMLASRPAADFLTDPAMARAAVLLFDQVPRNIHRDSPQAFAHDRLARAIMAGAVRRGWDRALDLHERQFLYMPLMHSEAIADQLLSLRLFARLGDSLVLGFARDHYRMIARFGRFPHRNAVLSRRSSPAELRAVAQGHAW